IPGTDAYRHTFNPISNVRAGQIHRPHRLPRKDIITTESPSSKTPVGPRDSTTTPRYAGPATYALLPTFDQVGTADIAVAGVPFDSGVSYRPGARFGPSHVRESSRLLRPYNP